MACHADAKAYPSIARNERRDEQRSLEPEYVIVAKFTKNQEHVLFFAKICLQGSSTASEDTCVHKRKNRGKN